MKMKPTIKKLWVKALRSGEYKQGKGHLSHGGPQGSRMCCLGVLSDLAVKQGVCSRRVAFLGNKTLHGSVMDWAGLGNENPIVGEYSLAEYNDDLNKTFKQISNLIQKHL